MKKILLGTVFGLICFAMPVCAMAQENETQPEVIVDDFDTDALYEDVQEIAETSAKKEQNKEAETEKDVSSEDKAFLDAVLKVFVPLYQNEVERSSITKDGNDYVVTSPIIGEIRCVRIDDLKGYAQYQAELSTIPVFQPILGKVQTTNLKNIVRFIPELGIVSYQDATAQSVQSNNGLSFKELVIKRNLTEKSDEKFDSKTDASVKNFLFGVAPYLGLSVSSIKGTLELENTNLANEILMSLDAQSGSYKTEIKGVEFETMLFPIEKASLNLKTELEYHNENDLYESDLDIAVSDIKILLQDKVLESKMPTYIDFETDIDGFTKQEVLNFYETSKAASLNPDDQALMSVAMEELNKIIENSKMDIDKLAFGNENYDILLSGKAQSFETHIDFDGTLSVRGFDFFSPETAKIDEEVCEKEKKALDELVKSTEEKFSLDYINQFEKQKEIVQTACVSEKNLLDDLRPFIKTARKEKDDKGRERLVFDIKVNKDGVFVNGEKSETLSSIQEE